MTSKYVVKLARATGDRKQVYNVKLRIPAELAKKLELRHGTKVVLTRTSNGFTVKRVRLKKKVVGARPPPSPSISSQ